jgi:hypothetical protein
MSKAGSLLISNIERGSFHKIIHEKLLSYPKELFVPKQNNDISRLKI